MDEGRPGVAPDYTLAACVSLGAVLWMVLMVVWAVLGFLWAIASAWGIDRALVFGRRAYDGRTGD